MAGGVVLKLDYSAMKAFMEGLTDVQKVELTQGIVDEFSKKHLRDVITDERMRKAVGKAQEAADKHITEYLSKVVERWNETPDLKQGHIHALRNQIRDSVHKIVEEDHARIRATYEKQLKERMAEVFTNQASRIIIAEITKHIRTDDIVKQQIDAAVQSKVRELVSNILDEDVCAHDGELCSGSGGR